MVSRRRRSAANEGGRQLGPQQLGQLPSLVPAPIVGSMRLLGLAAATVTAAGLGALGYAHWESRQPVLRRADLGIPGRKDMRPLRVLHLSDLHMYPGQKFIVDFIKRVSAIEDIDLVVSTGDNLGSPDGLELALAAYEPLRHLPGVFVLGSNDYYSPTAKIWTSYLQSDRPEKTAKKHANQSPDLPWLELVKSLESAGWVDLSNRSATLQVPADGREQSVSLIGVDDPHIHRDRTPEVPATWEDDNTVRLALTHAPYRRVLDRFAAVGSDLIFAGHTHGGQVRLPGVGTVVTNSDLPRAYGRGLNWWAAPGPEGGSWLNVSAGLGTSPMAPIRFACRPEATLLTIHAE